MAKGVFREPSEAADSTSVFEAPEAAPLPETANGMVPDVRGLGLRDAVYLLEAQGLKVRVSGQGVVKNQSIAPGNKALKGQTIGLQLTTDK